MVLGDVRCGQWQKPLELFRQMPQEGVRPKFVNFVGVLNACASMIVLEEIRCIHHQIIQIGLESDVFVGNSLVDMYAKCGSIEDAWTVFKNMTSRNVVTWNAILGGCAMHGHVRETLKHFEQMCEEGVHPNDITFVCLRSACSHAGLVDEAMHLYASMIRDYRNHTKLEHYNCMVDLLGRAHHLQEAENMVLEMPYKPQVAAWMALLGACRIHGNVEMAEHVTK
jgi:pentatricopeptide repeat protein